MSVISQSEADALLQLSKEFKELSPLRLTQQSPMDDERFLYSQDRREEFILTIERGQRKRARLKYQTRGRKVIVLARLDLDGPHHRNPPDSPYRPDERLACPHVHVYTYGFDDRVAYLPSELPGFTLRDATNGVYCLEDFFKFCRIINHPPIQMEI
jgi:galactose mutarotase-like enzyme